MIGWSGRTFGKFKLPSKTAAAGSWNTEEAAQWLSVNRWPVLRIKYENIPEYVDTTVQGKGKIQVDFSSQGFKVNPITGQANVFFHWEKAVRPETATIPWTPQESDWQFLPPNPDYGPQDLGKISLTLSDRLRENDRDYYRCVLRGGLKVIKSPPIQNQHDILVINWKEHPLNVTVPEQSDATFKAEAEAIGQFYGRDYSNATDSVSGEKLLALQYERRVFLSTTLSQGESVFSLSPNTADLGTRLTYSISAQPGGPGIVSRFLRLTVGGTVIPYPKVPASTTALDTISLNAGTVVVGSLTDIQGNGTALPPVTFQFTAGNNVSQAGTPAFGASLARHLLIKNPGFGDGEFGPGSAVQGTLGNNIVVTTVPHAASGLISFYGPWGDFFGGENGVDKVLEQVQFGIDQYKYRARAFIRGRTEPVYGNPISNEAILDITP